MASEDGVMSMMACSCCGEFRDTDDGEGQWDVPRINSPKTLDFVCGVCEEKYITEDGQYDPDLEEKNALHDQGERMAAIAEYKSLVDAQCVKGAFYVMDTINGRDGNPEGREALREILQAAKDRGAF